MGSNDGFTVFMTETRFLLIDQDSESEAEATE
jgi:hypothetical protein